MHKHLRDDRCRIASERLKIRKILRTDFCGQVCYSGIDSEYCVQSSPLVSLKWYILEFNLLSWSHIQHNSVLCKGTRAFNIFTETILILFPI